MIRFREATASEHRSERQRARSGASAEPSNRFREATASEHRSERQRARSGASAEPSNRFRTAGIAALLTLAASFAGVFALAGPASAHISVSPGEAPQGGYTRVAIRVPTESD